MKISVVTISFNQARFLEDTINSVISQDYQNKEYIIVDPGSSDGSREIIEKNSSLFSKIIFEPDMGPADGLNKGFSHATGDIFYYLNSDDIVLPGAFSKAVQHFKQSPWTGAIFGHGLLLDECGDVIRRIFSRKFSLACSYKNYSVIQQSTFIGRRAFRDVGGFNVNNHTCWDYELLVDIVMAGHSSIRVHDYLGGFRLYGESISGSGRLNQSYHDDMRNIGERILGRRPGVIDDFRCAARKLVTRFTEPGLALYYLNDALALRMKPSGDK